MQSDEELQNQLKAADPAPADVELDPHFLARTRARVQELTTMSTPTDLPTRRGHTSWWIAAAAGAAAALAIGIGIAARNGDDAGIAAAPTTAIVATTSPPTTAAPTTTAGLTPAVIERPAGLEAAPPPQDPIMAICAQFDPTILATAPVAFDGTVTKIDGTKVTFQVNAWFKGGSGDLLETDGVYITGENVALIGSVPAVVGDRYLVAAELYSDVVRPGSCGWVQPYSEEMAATYAAAFAS